MAEIMITAVAAPAPTAEEDESKKRPRSPSVSRRATKPDAQAFDEVRIFTVPRYKTSSASGDEWRISATVELRRKGKVITMNWATNMENAVKSLQSTWDTAVEDFKGCWAGEGDLCDQEGCSEIGTVTYELKKKYCRCGAESDAGSTIRKFCDRHSTRGDCGLEDADDNYDILSGGSAKKPRQEGVSYSQTIIM